MKVLVTGSAGFLGGALVLALLDLNVYTGFRETAVCPRIPGERHIYCDFTSEEVMDKVLSELKPNVIVHMGALSSPGACEKDIEKAASTNGADVLVRTVKKYVPEALVIYTSTDLVYEGSGGTNRAADLSRVQPGNAYAKTKVMGEKAVLSLQNSIVLRLSNMIGMGSGKFLDFLYNSFRERITIGLRSDEIRSFVSLSDVVRLIRTIILDKSKTYTGEATRVFNVGGPEPLSRLQLGEKLAKHFGTRLVVVPKGETEEKKEGGVWKVYEQSNQEAIEASGIFNPRDVSMDSCETEASFSFSFQSMDAAISEIFQEEQAAR